MSLIKNQNIHMSNTIGGLVLLRLQKKKNNHLRYTTKLMRAEQFELKLMLGPVFTLILTFVLLEEIYLLNDYEEQLILYILLLL